MVKKFNPFSPKLPHIFDLYEGHPSLKISLQPSGENFQLFETRNLNLKFWGGWLLHFLIREFG
jgi:hypothetical protein